MVFELLETIFGGLAIMNKCGKEGRDTVKNREQAIRNGESWYYDGSNKMRSTDTNEPVIHEYRDGNKLVGVRTGRVYRDYGRERKDDYIKKRNDDLTKNNSPVYLKECPEYYDSKRKAYVKTHLYERSTGRPYDILMMHAVDCRDGISIIDKENFLIVYLDENNGMKPVNEYAKIPNKYYMDYALGM